MSATKRTSTSISEPSDSPPTKKPLNSNPTKRTPLSKTRTNIPQHPSSSPTDSESESDSSSDSDSDSDQEIPLIRPLNARPVMRVSALPRSEGLAGLPDFLQRMKEANEELKRKVEAGEERGLEDVREGESYVEMDLGLGVWEEKKEGGGSEESSEDEEESGGGSEGAHENEDDEGDTRMGDGKAKGKEKKRKNVGIEEV
ncbi:Cysteine ase protein [Rutstroemia sp. NJR-2017a BBW]|nr:Cysteine ase protein [Rutstroemia sp. NJR-2017a BBW]